MSSFLLYILLVACALNVFYLLYNYLLAGMTHYKLLRFYFIASFVFSVTLPLFQIPIMDFTSQIVQNWQNKNLFLNVAGGESLVYVTSFKGTKPNESNASQIIIKILFAIFLTGAARQLFRFITQLLTVIKVISTNYKVKYAEYTIIEQDKISQIFSFFKYIVVNKSFLLLNENEKQQVIQHEVEHIKQLHTIDILFFEILYLILWFNPWQSKIKIALVEIHEFLADSAVVKLHKTTDYSRLLLKLATENKKINIGSAFNNIQLKNRILAMTISKSDKLLKWLFLMLVPVLMLILFVSSIVQNSLQNVRMNNSFVAPLSTENNEIIVDFFKNKQVTDNNGKLVVISHDKISFLTKSFEPILAVSDGIVNSIDTVNNFGLIELNISIIHNNNITSKYLGLETILKTTDATVKKGDTIGKTGDNRLYETFDFQLLNNDSSINPRNYIEF